MSDGTYIETGNFHVFITDSELVLDSDGMEKARDLAIVDVVLAHKDELDKTVEKFSMSLLEIAKRELIVRGLLEAVNNNGEVQPS